jgi:hypothetical protein
MARISGHSTYSAGAATVLKLFTGSDHFGHSVSFAPGSSRIEPRITPRSSVVLQWNTFTEAADEAGWSRRYGGIHFRGADLAGRLLGRLVGYEVWLKAQAYLKGDTSASR